MKARYFVAALIFCSSLTSCATYSSNVRIGNDMSYVSLSDQRTASQTVQQFDHTPAGAQVIGNIDAGRCHRSFVETAPAEEILVLDLKIAAYALGADAISNVEIEKQSALTKNCWYMLDGTATALRISQTDSQSSPAQQSPTPSTSQPTLTDQQIRQILIRQSIANYSGSCACPYNTASNGSRCGGRSAYSRPGGASPLCYDADVTPQMVANYRARISN